MKTIILLLLTISSIALANEYNVEAEMEAAQQRANQVRSSVVGSHTFKGRLPVNLSYLGTSARFWTAIVTIPTFYGPFIACGELDCSRNIQKDTTIKVESELVVNTWGEGKVTVILNSEGAKGRTGIQHSYVGFETGFDTYDLYLRKGADAPTPGQDKPVGNLMVSTKASYLNLFQNIGFKTTGKAGAPCVWTVAEASNIRFDVD